MNTHFLFNRPIFPNLLYIRPVPKSKFFGNFYDRTLQAGRPSRHPTSSVKALKNDRVSDWGQHAATRGQEHCNGCMGCLALRLQQGIPAVTVTVFLTLQLHTASKLSC